jgi:hypothetical protein
MEFNIIVAEDGQEGTLQGKWRFILALTAQRRF